jgi:molybdenum cofactor synthesis domain-containing protein
MSAPHSVDPIDGLPAFVLTVSDGVSAGTRQDRSGAVIEERLRGMGFAVERALVADEPDAIARLVAGAADGGARLVVTTGGTGLGPRDRTPEGVGEVIEYLVPGFGEAMRAEGRSHTPLASLSRSLAGVRGQTLVLCVPGSPRGAAESLDAVDMILAHTLDTLAGRTAHVPSTDTPVTPRVPRG